jgi:hypothetical protein
MRLLGGRLRQFGERRCRRASRQREARFVEASPRISQGRALKPRTVLRAEDRTIVDAGLKALVAFVSGPPLVYDAPAATLRARLR